MKLVSFVFCLFIIGVMYFLPFVLLAHKLPSETNLSLSFQLGIILLAVVNGIFTTLTCFAFNKWFNSKLK